MTESETLLTFPCEFVIKVFGNKSDEFEATVLAIVLKHSPALREDALVLRPSKDGKYLAISVTIEAESKQQLDTLYSELSAHPSVLMVL